MSPEDGATFGDPELFLALVALVMLGLLAYLMARPAGRSTASESRDRGRRVCGALG